jgi:hypothetical protein
MHLAAIFLAPSGSVFECPPGYHTFLCQYLGLFFFGRL